MIQGRRFQCYVKLLISVKRYVRKGIPAEHRTVVGTKNMNHLWTTGISCRKFCVTFCLTSKLTVIRWNTENKLILKEINTCDTVKICCRST